MSLLVVGLLAFILFLISIRFDSFLFPFKVGIAIWNSFSKDLPVVQGHTQEAGLGKSYSHRIPNLMDHCASASLGPSGCHNMDSCKTFGGKISTIAWFMHDLAIRRSLHSACPAIQYRRETTSVSIGEDHVVTTSSYGFCSGPEGTSIWAFAGPLAGVHFVLMIITNWLLYKISYLEDRYQEHKYVALASMFVFEVLVVGLPVLFSVGDNTAAVFLVLTGIIALNDVGMLCFLFLPKVYYRRQGLMTGVGIGESMRKSSYRKAKNREIQRSSGGIESNNSMAGSSRYGGSARDLQSSGGLTATETAEALKRQKSNDALDSDNIHDLKYAILEERCRFLEQKTIELERALEKANGPRVEEEALLEEKETAPTPDSNFTDSG